MFDDTHPMLVAGVCAAVISILLSKVIGVLYVIIYKRQQVRESLQVLDYRLRPVLQRMGTDGQGISWTKALDDADKSIRVSWYDVFNILKLYEIINAPPSDIYTTMIVAQLVAAGEAAAEAAGERVQGEWEWVSIYWVGQWGGQWGFRKVRVSPQRPPTATSLPPTPPYKTSDLPSCHDHEHEEEYVAVLRSERWEWIWVGVPGSEDWVWQWIAVQQSGEWLWLWSRGPPPPSLPPSLPPSSMDDNEPYQTASSSMNQNKPYQTASGMKRKENDESVNSEDEEEEDEKER